jgi:4-aminobutyrate aminotransferase-like enzyme
LGQILIPGLERIQAKHPDRLGVVLGRGLVAGVLVVESGTRKPDPETALAINLACFHKGLLMFAPVGIGGECVKIAPPLCITEEALQEGIAVLAEAVDQVLA